MLNKGALCRGRRWPRLNNTLGAGTGRVRGDATFMGGMEIGWNSCGK